MKKLLIGLLITSLFIFPGKSALQELDLDVPFVPTPEEVVMEMLSIADVGKDDVLYDLGCGDGRIVIAAAKNMGCRAVGVDIDPQRIIDSRKNAIEAGVTDKVQFLQQDLFEADISEATVVSLYLLQSVNLELRPKLLRDLKPGTRIVSHAFSMGEWKADNSLDIDTHYDSHPVYFWVIPANATGTWEWTMRSSAGKKRYVLQLDQHFQQINGIVSVGSSKIPIKDAVISGDRLQFAIEQTLKKQIVRTLFEGRVSGNSIQGIVISEAAPKAGKSTWNAKRDPSTISPIDSTDTDLKGILRTD